VSVRTLVISDLHLGTRLGRDVLRHPEALGVLLDALDGVDRLVLRGDGVELAEGRPRQALALAEPVLRAIGARMGGERQIVLVPGNHDRALARSWARAQGAALAVDAVVPGDASALLARVVGWLEPASVEVRTPGVWLSSRVWATMAITSIGTCCRSRLTGCTAAARSERAWGRRSTSAHGARR